MKFGCCSNMVASGADGTGIEVVEQLKELGYDYIELPFAGITALSDSDFENVVIGQAICQLVGQNKCQGDGNKKAGAKCPA